MINGIMEKIRRLSIVLAGFIISSSLVGAALYFYYDHFGNRPISGSVEKWGQFGDYIGGVLNPGLSFISIVLVCYTLYTTSRQSSIQSFESVLFELIRFHKEHLQNVKVKYNDVTYYGTDALSWCVTEVKFNFRLISDDEQPPQVRLVSSIDEFYKNDIFFSSAGHYFRNLYHIFKHIDGSSFLTSKEKVKYAKLVRAQLSSVESGALMLNGLSTIGGRSRAYIEKYSLLQEYTLVGDFKEELEASGALNFYAPEAYGDKSN
ncbi:putative phage abortive infection protein [Erwinia sp. HDF1-3R]|uniref:putative phage abortive infection protein n=1 Tax=Erwinia sp. HDF1-3R TaxID=3141543 RepID=UPI0031F47C4F